MRILYRINSIQKLLNKKVISVILMLFASVFLLQSYEPPNAGEDTYRLFSPQLLSRGSSTALDGGTAVDRLNPSVSGGKQRNTFDIAYSAITGFSGLYAGDRGLLGHGLHAGISLPSTVGVLTGSISFLTAYGETVDLGTSFAADFSFSKDIFQDFYFGIGAGLTFGSKDFFDAGAGLNIGILHLPGQLGLFKNFRWGISLINIGKAFDPLTTESGYPSSFTPLLGASFDIIDEKDVSWGFNTDLMFPGFQNMQLTVGTEMRLWDTLSVRGGWTADLRDLRGLDGSSRSLMPSFGISLSVNTNFEKNESLISREGWNRSTMDTGISASPLFADIWAFGFGLKLSLGMPDTNPPLVTIDYPRTEYISPNNDGIQDDLVIPIAISDERYVRGFNFIITDQEGNRIRNIVNKDRRPENETSETIFDRFGAVKSGIDIPKELRWDGKSDTGTVVKDGIYQFYLEAWDDNDNKGRSAEYSIYVDTEAPKITIPDYPPDEKIFSPNGDGNKDTIRIEQSGSAESLWTAAVLDSEGEIILKKEWKDSAPSDIVWSGENNDGQLSANGVYSYRITATDEAGNTGMKGIENIIINNRSTPIEISFDPSYFSPNSDKNKDIINFYPKIEVTEGLEEWSLEIFNVDGEKMNTLKGNFVPEEAIPYDGIADSGSVIPDDRYYARFSVIYENGNRPDAASDFFFADTQPPEVMVEQSTDVISPNGDGNKDTVTLFHETSLEEYWKGFIVDGEDNIIKSYTWLERPEQEIIWGGEKDSGGLAEDGIYYYFIESRDKAGNYAKSSLLGIDLDTEEFEVLVSTEHDAFSPNADGVKDKNIFYPKVLNQDKVESYRLSVLNKSESPVWSVEAKGRVPETIAWEGKTRNGLLVSDGDYSAVLSVLYENGNNPQARSKPFNIDTVYPDADVLIKNGLFSPNGDGRKDEIAVLQESSSESLWEALISDSDGSVVKRFYWKGELRNFLWDGKDDLGNTVKDGFYRYSASSTDQAGNCVKKSVQGIEVDTRKTSLFVTVDSTGFSPNADGYKDKIQYTVYTNITDGMESWKLQILDGKKQIVYQEEGEQLQSVLGGTWDGKTREGEIIEGSYSISVVAAYKKGDISSVASSPFILDISPPEAEVAITPKPFSPDNDGIEDELRIRLNVSDESEIPFWEFMIYDRNGKLFTGFSGEGLPKRTITWDGRSNTGDLVVSAEDYPYSFVITDIYKNSTSVQGLIPVDILLIRDGDRLKVQIQNITFLPDSPKLVLDTESDQGKKNREVLIRLAEIFSKYSSYNIRIEGHAVNVSGTEREEKEELQPLSLSRARVVKEALVELGIEEGRIDVLGRGGTEPIVPHTDTENRWKNRRVEFILIK